MDKKLVVAAGGVIGVVAIAYLLSKSDGANTGGVISGGMWGFPASGGATMPDPAPPVNIDFPGVTIPPMQTPVINYPEVTPVNYYYTDSPGGGSTKKQTAYAAAVDSSNPSSPFNVASKSTASVASGGGKKSGASSGGKKSGASSSSASTAISTVMGAASVASLASPAGAAVAIGSAIGKKAVSAAPSIASSVGSVASSIGGALSSIGKAFGW